MLKEDRGGGLLSYAANAGNKRYGFWKRDSLAVHLFNKEITCPKLDYIHSNPCSGYWQLVKEPIDYPYSLAKYYETGIKDYLFLKDLRDEY